MTKLRTPGALMAACDQAEALLSASPVAQEATTEVVGDKLEQQAHELVKTWFSGEYRNMRHDRLIADVADFARKAIAATLSGRASGGEK